ncbi:MAG TPA: hypothetical protein VJ738_02165 [Steroidobacteraceae bacterium]|nr:hypothetical protein [Steroidobacteraceae bacterium]
MTAGKGHWKCSLLRIGGPAIVMTLTAAHPGYSTDVSHELQRITASGAWLPLHLALLPGFALYGLSMLAWPTAGGRWWRLRQGGVVLSLVFYSAFVGVDGVAGWLLAHAGAQAPAGLRAGLVDGLTTLFSAALVGVLALVGVVGWLIAALAVTAESTAELRRLVPAGLLVLSALALGFSHAPPVGPVGAGFGLVAAILLDVLTAWQPERVGSAAGGS